MTSVLDRYIPRADVTDLHETTVRAPAEIVHEVAMQFDLNSIPVIHAIFWLRGKLLRAPHASPLPGGLVEQTKQLGWGVLEERPGLLVMGAYTQPWQASPVFHPIPASEFNDFAQPGVVKIAWTFESEPEDLDRTRFRTQTRAVATDDEARAKFRRYWRKFGLGVRLIRVLSTPAIRREAERRYRGVSGGRGRATRVA